MKKIKRKSKVLTPEQLEEIRVQEFFDRIAPSTVKWTIVKKVDKGTEKIKSNSRNGQVIKGY